MKNNLNKIKNIDSKPTIFNHLDDSYFLKLESLIGANITNMVKDSRFLLTFSELYSVFAISKAEDSELILSEAKEIQNVGNLSTYAKNIEDKIRVIDMKYSVNNDPNNKNQDYKERKEYLIELKKLYNKLEFANILVTYRYVTTSSFIEKIKQTGITSDILCELHGKLTHGLDDLFKGKGLPGYWKYGSGVLRKEDIVTIGGYFPDKAENIKNNLKTITNLTKSKNIKSIDNVFLFHGLLYRTHAFTNGNKRLSTIVEAILLKISGMNGILNTNIGYHYHKYIYKRSLLRDVISEQNFDKIIDLGKSSILLSAIYIIERELSLMHKLYNKNNKLDIFSVLPFGMSLTTKELNEKYNKVNKLGRTLAERTFYSYLEIEKSKVGNIIKEEKVGRNVYYSVNIQDPKFILLSKTLYELVNEYKKYNLEYDKIPFLKNY